jgi:hypothetical protein
LGYELEPPPAGFDSWDEYWRDVGLSEDELGVGVDRIIEMNIRSLSGPNRIPIER